jgi:hypothetical protein
MVGRTIEIKKWNKIFQYGLSKIIKFLSLACVIVYAISMLSFIDKSFGKNECFLNQNNHNCIKKDVGACTDQFFTSGEKPISLIRWIK